MERSTRMQLWKSMSGDITEKAAELANTYDMPLSPSESTKHYKRNKKTVIQKTASPDDVLRDVFCGSVTEHTEEADEEKTAAVLHPTVDVSGQEAPQRLVKTAQHYALPTAKLYPLDSYAQVKTASSYFDEWHSRMDVETKREFCKNMTKRASDLAIKVSPLAQQYGGAAYASDANIKMAIDARRIVINAGSRSMTKEASETPLAVTLDMIEETRAAVPAELFAETLHEFDKKAGITHLYGRSIPDPYLSTFKKEAYGTQVSDVDDDEAILIGNEYLPVKKLVLFSKMGSKAIAVRFGQDFADELVKDPVAIFKSLPKDEKLVLMRMASAVDADGRSATLS